MVKAARSESESAQADRCRLKFRDDSPLVRAVIRRLLGDDFSRRWRDAGWPWTERERSFAQFIEHLKFIRQR